MYLELFHKLQTLQDCNWIWKFNYVKFTLLSGLSKSALNRTILKTEKTFGMLLESNLRALLMLSEGSRRFYLNKALKEKYEMRWEMWLRRNAKFIRLKVNLALASELVEKLWLKLRNYQS